MLTVTNLSAKNSKNISQRKIDAAPIGATTRIPINDLKSVELKTLISFFEKMNFSVFLAEDPFLSRIIFFIDKQGFLYTCRFNMLEKELVFGHILKNKTTEVSITEFYQTKIDAALTEAMIADFIYCCDLVQNEKRVKCLPENKKMLKQTIEKTGYFLLND